MAGDGPTSRHKMLLPPVRGMGRGHRGHRVSLPGWSRSWSWSCWCLLASLSSSTPAAEGYWQPSSSSTAASSAPRRGRSRPGCIAVNGAAPVREAWDAREDIGEDVDVVYSDEDIVVANKPSGLLCVPGVSIKDSLATRVAKLYHHDRIDKMICHRLDMHTSGLVVLARSDQALKDLHAQFRERRVGKRYCAMVWGSLGPSCEGEVDLPLGPVRDDPPKQQVDVSTGKPSVTQWRILERLRGKTRVALVPVTGRSHQLRVHMAALGHPILGDYFYAHEEARGMASSLLLHAERLSCESAFLNPPPFCAANSIAPNPPVLHPITKEPLSFHIPPSF